MVDRDRRVAGQARCLLSDPLVCVEIARRKLVVRLGSERAKVHPAHRVVGDVRADVRAVGDRLHHRAGLRLGGREVAGAELLVLGLPAPGPVAIEIEALERRGDRDRRAVVVSDRPLGQYAVVLATLRFRRPGHEQAWLFVVWGPGAVLVLDAHEENASVAVNVLLVVAIGRIDTRVRPDARPDPLPGQRGLGAVRAQPGDDVERARVERARDALVGSVLVEQALDEVESRRRRCELCCVDLRLDEERGFLVRRTRVEVRHRHEPDVASFV